MQFFDGVFNRQTVAVPAGDVLRVKARELFGLDDHVFQHFVQRVADVQFAVGVGRAVVQHKQRCALAGHTQFFVQALLVPLLGPSGFAFGQVTPHGERGVHHVQCGTVVRGRRGGFVGHGCLGSEALKNKDSRGNVQQ